VQRVETTSKNRYFVPLCVVTAAVIAALIGVALSATAPIPGVTEVNGVVSTAIPLVRVLLDLAAVGAIGFSLLSILVGYDRPKLSEPVMRMARPAGIACSLIWAVSALAALVLQTAEFRPQAATIGLGDIRDYVAQIGAGKALLIVAVLALLHAGLGTLALKHGEKVPAEVRVGVGLFALLPLPVTGHASNWNFHDYTMISMELHVMSAVAWTGGLGAMALLLAGNRALLARAVPKFSKLATVCLVVSCVTGLFNGLIEISLNPTLNFWAGVFTTPYGQLMLLKTACGAAIAIVGAKMRWSLLPRLIRQERTAFALWATVELTIMGLAFGFAVMLTRAPVTAS
jgi:putative copper resistance protein D